VAVDRTLGEWLTEPKPQVWFDSAARTAQNNGRGVELDRRTRMAYDDHHIFINGESLRAGGRDARLMRQLADRRGLDANAVRTAGRSARECLAEWLACGWLHAAD